MSKVFKLVSLLFVVFAVTACSSKPAEGEKQTASVDTVSSASTTYFYEKSSLKGESDEFLEVMKNPSTYGAVTVATTNADGSPNVGVIIPSLVDEENQYLLMSFGSNGSTKQNLLERKIGVITVFKHNPSAEDKSERNVGARIVVELVEDQETVIKSLIEKQIVDEKNKEASVVVQIKKVIPLG